MILHIGTFHYFALLICEGVLLSDKCSKPNCKFNFDNQNEFDSVMEFRVFLQSPRNGM